MDKNDPRRWANDPFLTKEDFGPITDFTCEFLHARGIPPEKIFKPEDRESYRLWLATHLQKDTAEAKVLIVGATVTKVETPATRPGMTKSEKLVKEMNIAAAKFRREHSTLESLPTVKKLTSIDGIIFGLGGWKKA